MAKLRASWGWVGLALLAALAVAVNVRMLGLGEPEVVHDLEGATWYRIRGEDSFQQAIEACHDLAKRTMVPGSLGLGIPSDPNVMLFCCGRRASPDAGVRCDKPVGNALGAAR